MGKKLEMAKGGVCVHRKLKDEVRGVKLTTTCCVPVVWFGFLCR
jgi:hypothetical protein